MDSFSDLNVASAEMAAELVRMETMDTGNEVETDSAAEAHTSAARLCGIIPYGVLTNSDHASRADRISGHMKQIADKYIFSNTEYISPDHPV
jgi:hypothetical protein